MKQIITLITFIAFNYSVYYTQCNIIYVTPTGTGTGTKASPSSFLNAINVLATSGDHLKLDTGLYVLSNPITSIPDSLIIEGGFISLNNWNKTSLAGATTLYRDSLNVQDAGLATTRISAFELSNSNGFRFQDITIKTENAPKANTYGVSTYGVHLNGCSNYSIVRCQVIVGNASKGKDGDAGDVGADGENGLNGSLGSDNSKTNTPGGRGGNASGSIGGTGGVCRGCQGIVSLQPTSYRDASGGGGAGAGHDEGNGGNGAPSGNIISNTVNCIGQIAISSNNYIIGPSGNNSCEARQGNHGTNGTNGVNGCNGIDGVGVFNSFFNTGVGAQGIDGQGGSGGKGGSGGAGEDGGWLCNEGTASGGGGGGAGGQGGAGGEGGYGGGSSFGIFTFNNGVNSSVISSFLDKGTFGTGGIGGAGGTGGTRGDGGLGGLNPFNESPPDIGPGGNGGNGGSGGSGGKGGNGSNGISQDIYINGAALYGQNFTVLSSQPEIFSTETVCAGTDVVYTSLSIGFWDFGPNSLIRNLVGNNVITKYKEPGFHNVSYNGNVYVGFSSISILSPSLANAGQDSIACTSITLYADSVLSGTGAWNPITSGISITSPNMHNSPVTLVSGLNQIEWVVTYGTCCSPTRDTVEIFRNTPPTDPTSIFSVRDTVCYGDSAKLIVQGGSLGTDGQWIWYADSCSGTPVGIGDTVSFNITSNKTYFVRAESSCGNTVCVLKSLIVNAISVAADSIISSADTLCRYDSVILTALGGALLPGDDWNWYESSCGGVYVGTGTSIILAPVNNATYFVRGEGASCKPTTCVSKIIIVKGAVVSLIPFDTICGVLQPLILNNANPSGGYYSGTGIANGIFDPVIADYGDHIITYNYTDLSSGCVQSVYDTLVVSSACADIESVLVVNTFSPNGDGTNDTWNLNLGNYTKSRVTVFNKWGLKIFESNERIIQWDGTNQGKPLPAGSYFYVVEIDDKDPYQGSITIVR